MVGRFSYAFYSYSLMPYWPRTAISTRQISKRGGVNMQIQVFKGNEIVLELIDDDIAESSRVRQEIDLLTHAVKKISERMK